MGLRNKSKDPNVSREADEKRIRVSHLAPADTALLTSVASTVEGQNGRECLMCLFKLRDKGQLFIVCVMKVNKLLKLPLLADDGYNAIL